MLKHPSTNGLYALCAQFRGVPVRKLYEVLTNIGDRTTWDRMCQAAEEIEELEVDVPAENGAEAEKEGHRMLRGNVVWLGMKGMALLKPKVGRLRFVEHRADPLTSALAGHGASLHRRPTPLFRLNFHQLACAVILLLIKPSPNFLRHNLLLPSLGAS